MTAGNESDSAAAAAAIGTSNGHGPAALLLVESLIHGLLARGAITLSEAHEIVSVAAEVAQELADDARESPALARSSVALLAAIQGSLKTDLPVV